MYRSVPFGVASATEIARQLRGDERRIAGRKFPQVAKLLWPDKTAATLGAIIGASPRSCERWISGEIEPPYRVVEATMHEIFSGYGPVRQ